MTASGQRRLIDQGADRTVDDLPFRTTASVVAIGAILGITWSAALRAYMAGLAGAASTFTWWGTFGAVLLPGAIAGVALALAWRRGRRGRPAPWFALALAPVALVPLLEPGALMVLFTTGVGGGGIGVVVTGLLGGFAAGQRGAPWGRWIVGIVWLAAVVGTAVTPALVGNRPITTPRGAWLAVLAVGLIVLLSLACVAFFLRRVRALPSSGGVAVTAPSAK